MDNNMLYESADIMIYIQGRGVVAKEKSVVAYQKSDGKIVACGTEAYRMAGEDMEDWCGIKKLTAYSQGFHNKTKRIRRYSKWHVNITSNTKYKQ